MSTTEAKHGIRCVVQSEEDIKENNKTFKEALNSFIESYNNYDSKVFNGIKFVAPKDYDEDDGYVYSSSSEKGTMYIVTDGKNIGLEILLEYEWDSCGDSELHLYYKDFEDHVISLVENFGAHKETIKAFSYTWYNGSDEPMKF